MGGVGRVEGCVSGVIGTKSRDWRLVGRACDRRTTLTHSELVISSYAAKKQQVLARQTATRRRESAGNRMWSHVP